MTGGGQITGESGGYKKCQHWGTPDYSSSAVFVYWHVSEMYIVLVVRYTQRGNEEPDRDDKKREKKLRRLAFESCGKQYHLDPVPQNLKIKTPIFSQNFWPFSQNLMPLEVESFWKSDTSAFKDTTKTDHMIQNGCWLPCYGNWQTNHAFF